MKIAFLCSSLAPGQDGVGDYVRRLASACSASGHSCRLISFNERCPSEEVCSAGDEIRLSAATPWSQRALQLEAALGIFDPDWVSWQLVPYGFHPKGILPRSAFGLGAATRRWRLHVMLHEVWIGIARGETWRTRAMGFFQRRRLLAFLAHLRPAAIDTSNAAYQSVLGSNGWVVGRLPLFGNIPIAACSRAEAESALKTLVGDRIPPGPRWIAAVFGTIHPQWQDAATLAWLRSAAGAAGRAPLLLSIGRAGAHGEARFARIAAECPDLRVATVGSQPPEVVSRLLQAADFGVATHPWALLEKSGSTVALCEHGLPVLVPRDDWKLASAAFTPGPDDPLLVRLGDLPPSAATAWIASRKSAAPRLAAVAEQFLAALGNARLRAPVSA